MFVWSARCGSSLLVWLSYRGLCLRLFPMPCGAGGASTFTVRVHRLWGTSGIICSSIVVSGAANAGSTPTPAPYGYMLQGLTAFVVCPMRLFFARLVVLPWLVLAPFPRALRGWGRKHFHRPL